MTIDEWRNDLIGECEIPLWKFLRITHYIGFEDGKRVMNWIEQAV